MSMRAPPLLWLLTIGAIAFMVFLQWFLMQIRRKDEHLYERLGRPDLVSNNTFTSVVVFWRWVFSESFGYKGDAVVLGALWCVRVMVVLYLVGIALLLTAS